MKVRVFNIVLFYFSSTYIAHTIENFVSQEDSIDGIYDTLKQCAVISKYAGGIGLSIHNIRASQSYIR